VFVDDALLSWGREGGGRCDDATKGEPGAVSSDDERILKKSLSSDGPKRRS
jgi:hypothetical protein